MGVSVSRVVKYIRKGEKGDKGDQGVQGPQGNSGTTYYTWIRYADTITFNSSGNATGGTGMSDSPLNADGSFKEYIGFAYNKTTPTESDDYTQYKWTKFKGTDGTDGIDGEDGADGQTLYTWIKYADSVGNDGYPTAIYDSPTSDTEYIGIAVNKTTSTESTSPRDYQWSKFKGDQGVQGPQGDTIGVNPNILLRTIFDNGIAPVKQAWEADWNYVGIDSATNTIVQGRKSVRLAATNLSSGLDFRQDVYGRIKADTWYTLSFNYFSTAAWHFFIHNASNSTSVVDMSAGYIVDGETVTVSRIDGYSAFAANWEGKRHTITFKTCSSFSNTHAYILFRCLAGGRLVICMPKLEEGTEATAYVAHEDDLRGADGTDGGPGPRGYRGPGLRGPQDWNMLDEGYQFYAGDADTVEPYEDFVVYGGYFYKCIVSHTKTASNDPLTASAPTYNGGNPLWEQTTKLGIVAANILFGDHGYFGSAIISGDWMISTKGTINGTAYNNGATLNNIIAYSLFNPDNPSGKPITKLDSTTVVTFSTTNTTASLNNDNPIYLESGKIYLVSATGKAGSSSGQFYVRLRNASTGATHVPVMINGASDVTRSGYVTITATGSYYLEINNPSGYSGQVSACSISQMDFAPKYALNLLTGETWQKTGFFTGFVRKEKTVITTSNINTYKRTDIVGATVLDFDKCGSFIELSSGTAGYFVLPILSNYTATLYTEAQKNLIRGYVGTKLMVYNKTGSTLQNIALNIRFRTTDKSSTAGTYSQNTSFSDNKFMILECVLEADPVNGDENVYWQEIASGTIV